MDSYCSENEYHNEIEEKPTKRVRFGIEEDFVKILHFHPCLFENSQTPAMKIKKQKALQAVGKKINKMHGIDLSTSQIRKKIENMKGRIKAKENKIMLSNFPIILKPYEMQLLKLMDNKKVPVLKKMAGAEQCVVADTIKDCDDTKDVLFQEAELPGPSSCIPQWMNVPAIPKERYQNHQHSILELQKEVLIEQREINQQKKELNMQQKEIFALEKEKLSLQIALLKKKQN